ARRSWSRCDAFSKGGHSDDRSPRFPHGWSVGAVLSETGRLLFAGEPFGTARAGEFSRARSAARRAVERDQGARLICAAREPAPQALHRQILVLVVQCGICN